MTAEYYEMPYLVLVVLEYLKANTTCVMQATPTRRASSRHIEGNAII
ncbi:hypothetical protein LINPERHAP1_LOCUS30768 [Linum perenne]